MRSRSNAAPFGGASESTGSPTTARQQKSYALRRNDGGGRKGEGGRRALAVNLLGIVLLLLLALMLCASFVPEILDFINFSNEDSVNSNVEVDVDVSNAVVTVTEVITVPVMLPHGVDIAQKGKSANGNNNNNNNNMSRTNTMMAGANMNQAILSTVRKLDMTDLSKTKTKYDRPLLITGWQDTQNAENMRQFSKTMKYDNFATKFGNYTMFVKDEYVQPLKDKKNRKCIAPTSYKMKIMKAAEQNTLFFTNDVESPLFMRELTKLYTIPEPIDYKNGHGHSDSDGFHVFSGMVQGSYHGFNFHDEAQIYQVHGRKIW